jgi:hypothetical protein
MKVAVIIAGVPRTYLKTFNNFLKMLNGMDVDIFIFSWYEYYDKGIIDTYNPKKITLQPYHIFSDFIDDKIDFFKTLKWDKTQGFRKGHFNLKTGVMAQWYGVHQCFNSIDDPHQYDLILRYRFDWCPEFSIDWDEVQEICKKEICYSGWKIHGTGNYKINDMFAIGNVFNMRVYTSLYKYMMNDTYVNGIEENNCFIPEFLMAYHLHYHNIPVHMMKKYVYKLVK